MLKNLNQQLRILLKSSFLILLIACATNFEKTESNIASIDSDYGSSVQDYQLGLKYFDIYARETAMNQVELEEAISKLQNLYDQETSQESKDLIQFRIDLFEAEKFYKQASRGPKATFDGIIRCSTANETKDSIEQLRLAVEKFETAADAYEINEWTFMPSNWLERARESDSILLQRALDQEKVVNKNCVAQ